MKNYWVIGDIHGEIGLLERLLDAIDKSEPSEVVFVGDYIDRGPASRQVVDRIRNLEGKVTCLMGNHELMMLDALEDMGFGGSPTEIWYYNGAEATVQSFGFTNFFSFRSNLGMEYREFFRELKMARAIRTDAGLSILVTHAGISPDIPWKDQLRIQNYRQLSDYMMGKQIDPGESFLWVRESFFSADPSVWEGSLVVHGHTPVPKMGHFIGERVPKEFIMVDRDLCIRKHPQTGDFVSVDVDSGPVISGRLTAAGFFEEKDAEGRTVLTMRSLTVSREDIFPRDLGMIARSRS